MLLFADFDGTGKLSVITHAMPKRPDSMVTQITCLTQSLTKSTSTPLFNLSDGVRKVCELAIVRFGQHNMNGASK